tara:strand:+ start:1009 stop:1938 length:930 start_codon:yes stop_codon:yes gene_type:complete
MDWLKKLKKGLNVARKQGIRQAVDLATKGHTSSYNKSKDWTSMVSESAKIREHTPSQLSKIKKFDDSASSYKTDKSFNKYLKSKEGSKLFEEAYSNQEYESNYDYKVYDDDEFEWSSTGRTDKGSIGDNIGKKGILMPTRPGSVRRQEYETKKSAFGGSYTDYLPQDSNKREYVPLSEDIPGAWLTPDKSGRGVIFTDKEQEGSIDRFRKSWTRGDPLEKAFSGELSYNLLFEDDAGDVSFVQGTDYNKKLSGKKRNKAIKSLMEKMNPKNIYYQDAGMNQSFYQSSPGKERPYSNTTTMYGKYLGNGK